MRRHRKPVSRGERPQRAEAGARARRRDAGGGRSGLPVVEYTPAEMKRAVVGYGRAEKPQVGQMVKLLLGWTRVPARTMPPMRWRWRFVICSRVPGSGRLRGPRREAGTKRASPGATTARHRSAARMIAFLRGRVLEKHPNRLIVDVAGVGYDVEVPLSTFYNGRRAGRRDHAAHPHARARRSARPLRLRDPARAHGVRAADRGERHRPEAGAGGDLRHRAARTRGAIQRDDVARLADPRRGQENRRAHRRGARDRLPKDVDRATGARPRLPPARCATISSRHWPISGTIARRSTRCWSGCSPGAEPRFEDVLRAA